jgi:hypothetical protein
VVAGDQQRGRGFVERFRADRTVGHCCCVHMCVCVRACLVVFGKGEVKAWLWSELSFFFEEEEEEVQSVGHCCGAVVAAISNGRFDRYRRSVGGGGGGGRRGIGAAAARQIVGSVTPCVCDRDHVHTCNRGSSRAAKVRRAGTQRDIMNTSAGNQKKLLIFGCHIKFHHTAGKKQTHISWPQQQEKKKKKKSR